ncbi:MAG TPA: trehalose-6-phosphate synthase [Acidimicrobiales bacterium]
MTDLVVASNRGPLSFRLDAEGDPELTGSGGGLAGTLHPLLAGSGATWVAASMSEADRRAAEDGLMAEDGLVIVPVDLDPDVYRMAYDVVANATLWFCHHHLFDLARRPRFDRHWAQAWDAYRSYNQSFARTLAEVAPSGASVLVQDYHLALCGTELRSRRPDLRTVHFSHTPFADPSGVRVLPEAAADELLRSMADFGACGFHTARWEAAFAACFEDEGLAGGIAGPGRTFHSALGPDPEALATAAASDAAAVAGAELERLVGDRKLVVRVDRVELSKNILRGCLAFEELLETRPEWRDRVVLLALAYPSREGLADYLAYRSEVEHTVARINETWGTPAWTPIVLDVADARARSVAALERYDVLLVNPVRDGLNLVAKEGPLVNRTDGVLVVSREAGAWEELRPAALGINPFDVSATARALEAALCMDAAERARRATDLRKVILDHTAADWLTDLRQVADSLAPTR